MGPTSMAPDELESISKGKIYYYWEKYHSLVIELKRKIESKPDIIVSIGKGGSMAGVILAEMYGVENLNFGIKSYHNFNQSKIIEYQPLPSYEALRCRQILLVDDLADTGETLSYARDRFIQNEVEQFKTATVFKKTGSKFIPDYFVEEVSSDAWIVQPWEPFDFS
jgi:hypoxanthine phosphoribosyltransferase